MFNKIFDQIAGKNDIDKMALFELASSIRDADLKDENVIRDLIKKVSKIANKNIDEKTEEYLVNKIKNEGIPANLTSLFK